MHILDYIGMILLESWGVLVEASPYVLLGFFVAGLLKAYVPDSFFAKHLGGKSISSVFKAALWGVPLPLCSCGVLPAALGLRKQGASKGAATAFMISTPETGVDSMAVTYALIDPFMAVIRPVVAFLTAVLAGVGVNLLADNDDFTIEEKNTSDCGCSTCCETGHENHGSKGFSYGMQYAFGEMIADIGKWLLLGVVIAGVISALIPDAFIEEYIGHGFMSLVVMLVVGLPLYVCATASTPIAASLILKGLSPGAALVFLLAGPATNGATLTVMFRVLGKRAAIVYLVVIAAASLFFGWLVDRLYVGLGLDISAVVSSAGEILPHWVGIASAILLLLFVVRALVKPGACGCESCSS